MITKLCFFFVLALSLFGIDYAFAENKVPSVLGDSIVIKSDDPIAAMLDSLMALKYWDFEQQIASDYDRNKEGYEIGAVPVFDDATYQSRMAKLDASSPFALDFNPIVRSYIEMYALRRRALVSRMLGLSQLYFPMFEEMLDKYNLPLELKYLAIVESALNPGATSRVGATGLWQFMYGTGKMFNLNVTSFVDDRRNPYLATEAACKYFRYLHDMFHDWQLVLAAYNGGPGTVNKAIRRSGGKKNFWEIRPYLPVETQNYVPAFIAVNYVMNYTTEHNLYPLKPKITYYKVDTVMTRQQVSFYALNQVLNIPMEDLEYLNPMYKHNIIPHNEEGSILVLPIEKVGTYINNELAIYNYKTPQEKLQEELDFLARTATYQDVLKVHKVRKGENLATIAKKYHCTVAELKQWNKLKSTKVPTGKRLTVYVRTPVYHKQPNNPTSEALAEKPIVVDSLNNYNTATIERGSDSLVQNNNIRSAVVHSESKVSNKPKIVYYTVQPGDTLWRISQKFDGVTVTQLKQWNKINSNKNLKAGTKLKVNVKG